MCDHIFRDRSHLMKHWYWQICIIFSLSTILRKQLRPYSSTTIHCRKVLGTGQKSMSFPVLSAVFHIGKSSGEGSYVTAMRPVADSIYREAPLQLSWAAHRLLCMETRNTVPALYQNQRDSITANWLEPSWTAMIELLKKNRTKGRL